MVTKTNKMFNTLIKILKSNLMNNLSKIRTFFVNFKIEKAKMVNPITSVKIMIEKIKDHCFNQIFIIIIFKKGKINRMIIKNKI
jgi:hypothetical protein